VTHCLLCKEELKVHNKPAQVSVFTMTGPEIFSKYILRCRNCRLCPKEDFVPTLQSFRQDVWYHPDKVFKTLFCHIPTQPQIKLGVTKQLVGPPPHNPVKLLGHFQENPGMMQLQPHSLNF
jgi:hypothetical protein